MVGRISAGAMLALELVALHGCGGPSPGDDAGALPDAGRVIDGGRFDAGRDGGTDGGDDAGVACRVDEDGDGTAIEASVVSEDGDCDDDGEAPLGAPFDCDDEDADLERDEGEADCDLPPSEGSVTYQHPELPIRLRYRDVVVPGDVEVTAFPCEPAPLDAPQDHRTANLGGVCYHVETPARASDAWAVLQLDYTFTAAEVTIEECGTRFRDVAVQACRPASGPCGGSDDAFAGECCQPASPARLAEDDLEGWAQITVDPSTFAEVTLRLIESPTDFDFDGYVSGADNCLCAFNPSQSDDDGDGEGNACEA